MIRVGFVYLLDESAWSGGVSYFRNLLGAISANDSSRIVPVLLTSSTDVAKNREIFQGIEVIGSPIFDRFGLRWALRKLWQRLTGFDLMLARLARAAGLELLSHSMPLGSKFGFTMPPTLGWIADFQHLRMPEFFSKRERVHRDRLFRRICAGASRIVVSSENAQKDLAAMLPDAAARSRVLHFVSLPGSLKESTHREELRERHNLTDRYFHLPNKFWAHKNHEVVIKALGILRRQGRTVQVVATGSTQDERQPRFFEKIQHWIQAENVADQFRILGLVSMPELQGLMLSSLAVINPSLFEGWSTSVEEAKSLGKTVVLSDIPVHREQEPERGRYFDPKDPAVLACMLWETQRNWSPEEDAYHRTRALAALPTRRQGFAAKYEDIAIETLGDR